MCGSYTTILKNVRIPDAEKSLTVACEEIDNAINLLREASYSISNTSLAMDCCALIGVLTIARDIISRELP